MFGEEPDPSLISAFACLPCKFRFILRSTFLDVDVDVFVVVMLPVDPHPRCSHATPISHCQVSLSRVAKCLESSFSEPAATASGGIGPCRPPSSAVDLVFPDYSLPFELHVDGSKARIWRSLASDTGRKATSNSITLKALTLVEINYGSTELETAALVWAFQFNRNLLSLASDHQNRFFL